MSTYTLTTIKRVRVDFRMDFLFIPMSHKCFILHR